MGIKSNTAVALLQISTVEFSEKCMAFIYKLKSIIKILLTALDFNDVIEHDVQYVTCSNSTKCTDVTLHLESLLLLDVSLVPRH